jgi:hypothetical protein
VRFCLILLALVSGCGRAEGPSSGETPVPDPLEPSPDPFVDVTAETGLDFVHVSGRSGQLYMVEMMGGGCAVLDYDNDGDLDLYLVQGHPLGPDGDSTPGGKPSPDRRDHRDRLYRNDLGARSDPARPLSFRDVTGASGIEARHYGMGAATGDYDNDGWVDLYVTNFGTNQLWHNNGNGSFSEVAAGAGVDDESWSVAASFFDYDRDGWLDLFVVNYVDFSLRGHRACYTTASARDYCGPDSYNSQPDRLYRNRGDGTFEDVTVDSKIVTAHSSGLGVVTADFDDDGWSDIYVANDNDRNFLWINRGDGTFAEEALVRGCAVNWAVETEASMGVEAGDLDGDGDLDVVAAHMDGQTNTLWANLGGGIFEDATRRSGLGKENFRHTTYAPVVLDFDNDGRLDMIAVNGAMQLFNLWNPAGDPHPLREPNQLYRNTGGGVFEEVTAASGAVFELSEVSRGGADGDLDNDGDRDLLYANIDGPARVLLNRVGNRHHWIGLRVMDASGRRDAHGSRVELVRPAGPPLVRRVGTDGSYASASDARVLFGLGDREEIRAVRVRWPDGHTEEWTDLPVDRYSVLHPGTGRPVENPSPRP